MESWGISPVSVFQVRFQVVCRLLIPFKDKNNSFDGSRAVCSFPNEMEFSISFPIDLF